MYCEIKFILRYILIFVSTSLISQLYVSSDPYYLLKADKEQLSKSDNIVSTAFRPFYLNNGNKFFFSFKNEIYFNDNAPNQENMDVRI